MPTSKSSKVIASVDLNYRGNAEDSPHGFGFGRVHPQAPSRPPVVDQSATLRPSTRNREQRGQHHDLVKPDQVRAA